MYKLTFPPYGENEMVNSLKPIRGIKYYKGAKSAYRSITRIGGKVPPVIKRDMGIMDIKITTPAYGKPKMTFTRDVKQKTRLTRRHKRPQKRTKSGIMDRYYLGHKISGSDMGKVTL